MLTVGELAGAQLRARLAGPGLRLRTGAFVAAVVSPLPQVAEGIALLYGDYPLAGDDGFADFHVSHDVFDALPGQIAGIAADTGDGDVAAVFIAIGRFAALAVIGRRQQGVVEPIAAPRLDVREGPRRPRAAVMKRL